MAILAIGLHSTTYDVNSDVLSLDATFSEGLAPRWLTANWLENGLLRPHSIHQSTHTVW